MKTKIIFYWISTLLVVAVMTISGVMAVTHAAPMMKALAHLGYPPYFVNLLGVAKLAGVCVLLAPGCLRLKEWAYAGFTFDLIGAFWSHLASGQRNEALFPALFLLLLAVSYSLRPFSRRLATVDIVAVVT